MPDVHALTDVTGFGLLGHLMEICRGSGVAAMVDFARLPLHPDVLRLAREGIVTGASARNWAGVDQHVDLARTIGTAERALLTDPQTSGGLLVACAPGRADEIVALFHADGFAHAAVIGSMAAGTPRIAVG
jgi:selenide,water dikinase